MKTNWPTKKLGEVCEINMGQSPSSSTYNQEKIGLPFYQGKKDYGEKYPTPRVWCSDPIKIVETGDILISVRAPVGALNIAKEKSCIGRGLAGLRGKANLDQDYLFHFLKLKEKEIADLGTGSTFTAISKKHLENLEIPLPPLSEQKKIVAKLERVLAKINEAKKLRAEARENTDNFLPAELHKIFGSTVRSNSLQANSPQAPQQHSNILQNVGMSSTSKNGWEEKEINDICKHPQYGFTASSRREQVGPKFLRITDIQEGKVNWGAVPYCKCLDTDKYKLAKGDIVFARTGATVGKSYLISEVPKEAIYASYLIRLRVKDKVIPGFLYYFFQSPEYWEQITSEQVGMAQPNVNGSKLAKIKIPLPPLAEQKRIVKHLDSLSQKLQKLKEYQKSTQSDLLTFERSILHKAFL